MTRCERCPEMAVSLVHYVPVQPSGALRHPTEKLCAWHATNSVFNEIKRELPVRVDPLTEQEPVMATSTRYTFIPCEISGRNVKVRAKITQDELPTGAPRTIVEFHPETPEFRNGDSFTITTTTELT